MTINNRSQLERYINEEFQAKWVERLGETGRDLTHDLRQLVDLILIDQHERVEGWVKELIVPWALQDSDEKIPVSMLDKEGIIRALFAPGFMSASERVELAQALLEDVKKRGFTEDR